MSLIVAKREGENICIVSDTKLTYPDEKHPKLQNAAPDKGVIKSVIINEHVCISFACDDIDEAEKAIRVCRELYNDTINMLKHLNKTNKETNGKTEFLVCVTLPRMNKIYEIKDFKITETPYAWIGSKEGYNVFQEMMHLEKAKFKREDNILSDLSSAMSEVIKSGKEPNVNGFSISISNAGNRFNYNNYLSIELVPKTYYGSNHVITHGTAAEGGYSVKIFSPENRYDIVTVYIVQSGFGIIYKIINKSLLRPEIINNVNEHEFAEILKIKYAISIPWFAT